MRNRILVASIGGGALLVLLALFVNSRRPRAEVERASQQDVKGTGKCVECHRLQTAGIVRQWEDSKHAKTGVSCLDCHKPRAGMPLLEHKGFQITRGVTSGACAECHRREYAEFQRSRHAAASWTAVAGTKDFTAAQLEEARRYHPEAVDRPAHPLIAVEGAGAMQAGCKACHEIGAPNADASIGNCTKCHGKHAGSVAMARTSDTCGSCHMGPDHSQIEIWRESPHGVMFVARRDKQNLDAPGASLTARDQDTPTCSTCHFSGIGGIGSSHDVSERLSYYLFAPVSTKRPGFDQNRGRMRAACLNCHAASTVDKLYAAADVTLERTNEVVKESQQILAALEKDGLMPKQPFSAPIQFLAFDLWHYFGRTAKHGAYMGGADFSQWHGNYELQLKLAELRTAAADLRKGSK